MEKPQIGDLVWVKFPSDRDGKWIEVEVDRVEDRMFYGTPTGDPIVGWLGENIVLKGFENQVGAGGYDTWAFERPVESAPTASDTAAELAALRDEVRRLREAMSEALVIIDEQAPALSGWRARDVMAALRAALEVTK